MVAYELIKELEQLPYFNQLLKSGLLPINWIDYKVIYEFYLNELKVQDSKTQALTNTSTEFNISERSVYLIIQKMRG